METPRSHIPPTAQFTSANLATAYHPALDNSATVTQAATASRRRRSARASSELRHTPHPQASRPMRPADRRCTVHDTIHGAKRLAPDLPRFCPKNRTHVEISLCEIIELAVPDPGDECRYFRAGVNQRRARRVTRIPDSDVPARKGGDLDAIPAGVAGLALAPPRHAELVGDTFTNCIISPWSYYADEHEANARAPAQRQCAVRVVD